MAYRGRPQRGPERRPDEPRVNRRIRVREVRVIDEDGSQLGILPTEEAMRRAEEKSLDLVEVSPTARPPVCKIMDYGKFKYEQKRKAAVAKKNQHQIEVKEVKFRPKTDKHDFDVKMSRVKRFLAEGNKCKVTIMFRGREIVHPEIGQEILVRVAEQCADVALVESSPRMEGRQMFMIIGPSKGRKKPAEGAPSASAPLVVAAPPVAAAPRPAPIGGDKKGPEITRAPQVARKPTPTGTGSGPTGG